MPNEYRERKERPVLQSPRVKSEVTGVSVKPPWCVHCQPESAGPILTELLKPRHLKDPRRPVSLPLMRGGTCDADGSLTPSKPSRRRVTVFFLRAGLLACLDRTLHGAFSWRTIVWLCGRLHHITGLCLTGPLSHRSRLSTPAATATCWGWGRGDHLYMYGTKRRGFCDLKVCNRWVGGGAVLVHFNPIPET